MSFVSTDLAKTEYQAIAKLITPLWKSLLDEFERVELENALAITANLKVTDIEESLLVHPTLAEALAEAAEQGAGAKFRTSVLMGQRLGFQ